ncbi:hypothetical protein, variant 4 [Phytophthora nicotianae P10297]|uniref:non-specific serine/threonine protein kinase n=2 Tax=Phytophthora nicotianae TaxID=4792 RepID=V9E658_PHYNI|nr:hypothetical protein, variant 3 [Phytophthora nicotianae P1569]ETP32588.1 hypothetical protein, variant 4 [Phytophthora nicotianae P10297]
MDTNEMKAPLQAVIDRLVEEREHVLGEERITLASHLILGGIQDVLKCLERERISSDTEESLKRVWDKSDQEAAAAIITLLHQGVDAKSPDGGAAIALQYALRNSRADVISLLLERGADVMSLLLEQGADVGTQDEDGKTALHYAVTSHNTDVMSLLLERGADLAARYEDDETILHYAVRNGDVDVISLLLEKGADVAATDNNGEIALHYAASFGHTERILLLLDRGSDVNASDNDQLTVLHHAVTRCSPEAVLLLLNKGADANALTKDGLNPLSHMILVKEDDPDDDYLGVVRLLCSQEPKLKLPPSTQSLAINQLGMLACAQYWQDRYEKKQPLLEIPSEVVKGGENAVEMYLAELEKTDSSEVVHRQKICVVGRTKWGKTSLVRSITEETSVLVPLEDRTIGIEVFPLRFTVDGDGNKMKATHHDVTFWDFAGQGVYRVAHAVFFSKRTLYLVCVDLAAYNEILEQAKKESKTQRDEVPQRFFEKHILRWIVLILLRQPEAEFKLIGTKHDEVSDSSRSEISHDIRDRLGQFLEKLDGSIQITGHAATALKKEFEEGLVTTSVTNVESIQKVKNSIKHTITAKPHLSFKMPITYTRVINYILEKRQSVVGATNQDRMDKMIVSVRQLCKDLLKLPDFPQDTDCREILRVLHELGDVLWYKGIDEELEKWIILDPSVVLDLVREVINHKYKEEVDEQYKVLSQNGILPHSLLMTFPSWKSLAAVEDKMVHLFKQLLHRLNLVYPVNDMEAIDKADILVPMYWKTRETPKADLKLLATQKTILTQDFGDSWHVATWRYWLPIVVSDAIFVNFVVKCYRPFVHRSARRAYFESSVRREFRAVVNHSANKTGQYNDILIEVAAPTEKLAWAEMMYFVTDMEKILEKDYPGLTKHARVKRFIVDDGEDRGVNDLMENPEDGKRQRAKARWLPPDFSWFTQCAWKNGGVYEIHQLRHQLEAVKNIVVTSESCRLPRLWTLLYPRKGSHVELRIHSDVSGKCEHKALQIPVNDNILTRYPKMFQFCISALSAASVAIPNAVAVAAVNQVLEASKSALNQKITAKEVLDRANLGAGEEKSSHELGMGPAERRAFLLQLLALHDPSFNEDTIGRACQLQRGATKEGYYIWLSDDEYSDLKHCVTLCDPESGPPVIPILATTSSPEPSISLRIIGAEGTWKPLTKMYCAWELLRDLKVVGNGSTSKTACTEIGTSWESTAVKLNFVDSRIKMLRDCTLVIRVKKARSFTCCFRSDKVIVQGETQLCDHVNANCSTTQLINVPISVATGTLTRTVNCQIKIKFIGP